MANLPLSIINSGVIPRASSNRKYTSNSREVYITCSPAKTRGNNKRSTAVSFNWHFQALKNYKYVTFYRVKDEIYFKFSNTLDDLCYTITNKSTGSSRTAVIGDNAELLKDFAGGVYTLREYGWWNKQGEAMYYIEKSEKY